MNDRDIVYTGPAEKKNGLRGGEGELGPADSIVVIILIMKNHF